MTKKITFLITAALMLLTMMATTGMMWGQTRDTQTVSYGWETTDNATPWTISDAIVATSGQGNTGSYAGRINTNSTTVQFNEKVYVTSFSYAFKRTSTNNNYSVYIETSTDGSTWSIKDTQAMNTFTNGSYRTVTKEFDGSQELYVRFRCNNTTAVRYVDDVTITYSTSASQLDPCDLTLTNASTSIVFDLYNNLVPFVINYTTSSTGTVSVAENDYVETVVDQVNKTITVTPIAITNGAKVITVNQAADDNYTAGSKTFTINITDSTPFSGGDVTFVAGTDIGSTTANGTPDVITKYGVTISGTDAAFATAEYRMYKNSTTTISTSTGAITNITFTCTQNNPAGGFGDMAGFSTEGNNGTWAGNAASVAFIASNAQVRATQIVVTIDTGGTPDPSITASDVDIAYDATQGSITYTVNNPVSGGTLTANTTSDWLTLGTNFTSPIAFACSENNAAASRTATVTLTYTYNTNQTVTKDVTVTQAGNPDYTMTIAEVRPLATGTMVTTKGIVTSITTSGNNKTAYIQDNTAGIVVYGAFTTDVVVGDEIRVEGELTAYKGLVEIGTSNNAPTVTVLSQNNTVTPVVKTIAEIDINIQAMLIRVENATVTEINGANTTIAQGTNTIVVRNLSGVVVNNVISLTANVGWYDAAQLVNPTDVQVVAVPSITLAQYEYNLNANGGDATLPVTYTNMPANPQAEVIFYEANGTTTATYDWITASINANYNIAGHINVNEGDARSAYFKVKGKDANNNDVYSNLVTINQAAAGPNIEFNNTSMTLEAGGESDRQLSFDYSGLGSNPTFSINYYEQDGTTAATYNHNWLTATIEGDKVNISAVANTGEERKAYFKVYGEGNNTNAESNLVTITQAANVVDYATLPFAWEGGTKEVLVANVGVTGHGLGANYAESNAPYRVKFDTDGDYILIKTNAQPGVVTVGIKKLGGANTSSIIIKGSSNGEDFTTIQTFDNEGEANAELEHTTTVDFNENDRYVMIYFNKPSGGSNVGVGPITIATYVAPVASITIAPAEITDVPAAGDVQEHTVTLANMTISSTDDFEFVYCDAEGNILGNEDPKPNWIELAETEYTTTGENTYSMVYTIAPNEETTPRTGYFKIGVELSTETVYSNIVTVTQLGYVAPVASITVDPDEVLDVPAEGDVQEHTVTLANMTISSTDDFEFVYCDAEGNILGNEDPKPNWIELAETEYTTTGENTYSMVYTIAANEETTPRTGYFKIGVELATETVYSNIVTVTQLGNVPPVVADNYELFNGDLEEGDYIIYYNGYAMKNTVSSNRLTYETVTPSENVISTNDATIVWHIAPSGDFWTIYSADANAYAASTGTKNQAQMLGDGTDDKALWTASGTYDFVNKQNTANNVNATLRYNAGYGFACYATSTGGALSLYKKVDNSPSITAEDVNIAYDATEGSITYTINNPVEGGTMGSMPISGGDWLTVDGPSNGSVALTCEQNTGAERTATVRLTYTYNNTKEAVTKDVTVTQAGAPIPTYTVSFDVDGGEFVPNDDFSDEIVEIEAGTYSLPSATKGGYTFDGWYDGDQIYAAGESYTVSDDVDFTATYTELQHFTIHFFVNGEADDDMQVVQGNSVDLPMESNLTPNGFSIYGWALENSITAVENPYTPTGDVTLYALLQMPATEYYEKVTANLTDWSGEYLIVYEDGNVAFDGSLTTLDVAQNTIAVSITNNTIEANTTTDASMFTITALSEGGYSIQSASGYYIGQTSNNNGMATSQETAYANTISINDNSATIVSGGAYLRYNNASNQNRFRYYKSSSYTGQQPIQLYRKVSETPVVFNNVTVYDDPLEPEPVMDDPIPETTCVVVGDGITLTLNNVNNGTAANLVVQEGGQLIHTTDVEATLQKVVEAYTPANRSGDGWYMIATPVDNLPKTAVASTSDFDLFLYNEPNAMWYAHWDNPGFETLYRGKGYLYANAADVDLNYAGLMKATDAEFSVPLSYKCDAYPDMKGFNLVGNPFTRNLKLGDMKLGEATLTQFYVVNPEHTGLVTIDNNSYEIKPGEGFFVQAKDENQTLEFNPSTKGLEDIRFIKIVAGNENGYDNAYINIGCGNTLRKTNIANLTSVYVMDQGLDYSAARVEELAGNMPVHFAPSEDGFFTITVEAKNLENINFMHLIDNIENTAINLLAEPTYTFKAGTSDNEDRFTLVFDFNNYLGVNENNLNDSFVYQSGDELILNGEGTLQVFDMMGRFVMSKEISGSERISTSIFETGVYVLRFVGETVMTQKIVIE